MFVALRLFFSCYPFICFDPKPLSRDEPLRSSDQASCVASSLLSPSFGAGFRPLRDSPPLWNVAVTSSVSMYSRISRSLPPPKRHTQQYLLLYALPSGVAFWPRDSTTT